MDVATLKRNRLFCNKIWQSLRFLFLLLERLPKSEVCIDLIKLEEKVPDLLLVNQWIMSCLVNMVHRTNQGLASYDLHHSTTSLYEFLYGNLCDVFLEAIKPLSGKDQLESTLILVKCLDISLRCLTPFMPFLSEELYQRLHAKIASHGVSLPRTESVLIAHYPTKDEVRKLWLVSLFSFTFAQQVFSIVNSLEKR